MIPGDKPPPHSPEVEAALIGASLVNPEAFTLIAEQITADEFYDSRHQKIFKAMTELFEKNTLIDPVTVMNTLKEARQLEAAGGTEYLASLVSMSVPLDGCEHYARIVRTSASLRKMIFTAAEITSEAYNGGFDPEEFLTRAEERLLAAGEQRITKQVRRVGEIFPEQLENIEKRRKDHTMAVGISTGYKNLDKFLTGFHDSDLVILAARPAMGKTSFAINLAMNAAFNQNKAVLFVSLEMAENQITDRVICVKTGFNSRRLAEGQWLTDADMNVITQAMDEMSSTPLFIDDTARIGMLELRAKARRLKSRGMLDMIMIDYLQLMDPSDKRNSREQQISEISRNLKAMAKELNIPVIALSQLSRAPETRPGDKRPLLSDLRESGAIEQDADVVLFLFRPEYYKKRKDDGGDKRGKPVVDASDAEDQDIQGLLEVRIAKHRNGPTGTARLTFIPESMSITDRTSLNESDFGPENR